jgi:hypothetical protein
VGQVGGAFQALSQIVARVALLFAVEVEDDGRDEPHVRVVAEVPLAVGFVAEHHRQEGRPVLTGARPFSLGQEEFHHFDPGLLERFWPSGVALASD